MIDEKIWFPGLLKTLAKNPLLPTPSSSEPSRKSPPCDPIKLHETSGLGYLMESLQAEGISKRAAPIFTNS